MRAHLCALDYDFAESARLAAEAAGGDPNDVTRLNFAARSALIAFQVEDADRLLRVYAMRQRSVSKLQGMSESPAQSHIGHLIAEWRLDRDALARTMEARNANGQAKIDALKRVVAQFGDYTPASLALFIELRREGMLTSLAHAARIGGPRLIPKTLVQFWDEEALPDDLEQICSTWSLNNPGYHYKRFSSKSASEYLQRRHGAATLQAFLRAREPAQKADIFRLAYLFAEGGYYADVDDRCVAPIEVIDPGGRALLLYQEDIGSVANSFIGAAQNDKAIGEALELAVASVNRGDGDVLWLSTGPGLLTRVLGSMASRNDHNLFADVGAPLILDRNELFRSVRIHCMASYKQTRRHWTRSILASRSGGLEGELDELLSMIGMAPAQGQ